MSALDRREVVARLLRDRGEAVVVTGLGNPTWDVAAAGDHARNLYLWGAMGGAVAMALGLALARPETPIWCVTGDGEMMMGLGSLAVAAQSAPANLSILVLDNGEYGETGAQRAHTAAGADLAAIARGCGIAAAVRVEDAAGLEALA
ncbi:MAG: thiamine pyrophosphate-dependent enzyme, partial [Pseudomonadota bacterium]